ncbi:mitochondrial zinc maintenance protein 1, mitochondrial [Neoconidiobolus thromboides FSU 785]|nr:mitochondrial zinc maintenance protein 1, mitochondrial [Neoconidiobolus thromboides FSU 785]
MNPKAIQVYRYLLKVQRTCFKGDLPTLKAAHLKTRSEFELYRNETNEDTINKSIQYAKEVAKILERNVVQAVKSKEGASYKLNLNEGHEINDNDTIRQKKTNNRQVKKCCSS